MLVSPGDAMPSAEGSRTIADDGGIFADCSVLPAKGRGGVIGSVVGPELEAHPEPAA